VIPFLKARFPPTSNGTTNGKIPIATADFLRQWTHTTITLLSVLPPTEIFPLIDFWRAGLLDDHVSNWIAAGGVKSSTTAGENVDIVGAILKKAVEIVENNGEAAKGGERNLLLTTLRMVSNGFANPLLARYLLSTTPSHTSTTPSRTLLTSLLVSTLLHSDALVRTASASLAFNISAHLQRPLIEAVREGKRNGEEGVRDNEEEGQGDWEVEVVSAIVEGVRREGGEDVGELCF